MGISPGQTGQRTTIAPEFRDIHSVGAVATNEPLRPDSPELIERCTPLFLQFRGSFDLRFRIQDFDRRSKQLQSISLGYAREQPLRKCARSNASALPICGPAFGLR
jgi:hypothetical protein